jgi:acyl-CoA reductase-like NAD-dependent aldehyde dehydrogenase
VEADNIKHAIELANSSDYTLTAALFTQNVSAALQVASAIRAGATIVNGSTFHPEPTNTEIGLG